jgi:hypothetical protein
MEVSVLVALCLGLEAGTQLVVSFQAVQDVTKDVFSVVFSCAAGLSDMITVDDVVVTLEPPGYNAEYG